MFNLNNYTFSWSSVPVTVVGCIVLAIGLFILKQNPKSVHNFSFFLLCLSVFIWLSGYGLVYSATDPNLALTIYRWYTFLGVSFIAVSVYFFSVVWLDFWAFQKKFVLLGYALFSGIYLIGTSTDYVTPFMDRYFWGYYSRYGWLGVLFFVLFVIYFSMSFVNFAYRLKHPFEKVSKKQVKAIIVSFCIAFTACIDYLPKLAHIEIYPFGYILASLWIFTVGYAIIKYKVMDIETVIHKTLMWAVISSVVFLPLGFSFYFLRNFLLSIHPALGSILAAGVFLLFVAYAKKVQPWIDHLFQRRKHDLENILIKFNDALVHLKDLTELSNYMVQTVREVLYVAKVQVFLKHSGKTSLIQVDSEADKSAEPSTNNTFIRWLEEEDQIALAQFVDIDPRFDSIKSEAKHFFKSLGVHVTLPLVLNRELIGLINLSEKANLKPFRAAEITFLSELRRAATIAFSNSLRLIEMQESLRKWNEELEEKVRLRTRELEDAQKQLVQAEKMATLGTLAGGVAHEINNPLTAVLTNAQILKMTAKDNDEIESINLIEEGAKRCQAIVQKLMKYARKPAEEEIAKEVDLNSIIESTLAFLGYQLEQENIRLVKHLNSVSKVKGVPNELVQVFTNIMLNAKDAVKAAKSSGSIEIKTFEKNGCVCASVTDDGVGIPEKNISKIFDPFFTTKDVGKGTGLGLSIIYGIVEKHGGKIEVSSKMGQGSTFTVSLPK